MKIDPQDFQVMEGHTVELKKRPTRVHPFYKSQEQYKDILKNHIEELSDIQNILYADNRYALLLIFQAMDAAGKDGAIKHVMSGVNPQGCQVFSFKHPSPQELDHDFLWRTTRNLPERGKIGIFNRSYYEEVLVARVHPEILQAEQIPDDLVNLKSIWEERYRSIRDLEKHLYYNGTRVIKFFCTYPKKNNASAFLNVSMIPLKTGKSAPTISKKESSGRII
jgi:polyphosphate kinase 2 (PPK2 family)